MKGTFEIGRKHDEEMRAKYPEWFARRDAIEKARRKKEKEEREEYLKKQELIFHAYRNVDNKGNAFRKIRDKAKDLKNKEEQLKKLQEKGNNQNFCLNRISFSCL